MTSNKIQENLEELWDSHSIYIDDNLFSLQQVADQSVLTRSQFDKLVTDLITLIDKH